MAEAGPMDGSESFHPVYTGSNNTTEHLGEPQEPGSFAVAFGKVTDVIVQSFEFAEGPEEEDPTLLPDTVLGIGGLGLDTSPDSTDLAHLMEQLGSRLGVTISWKELCNLMGDPDTADQSTIGQLTQLVIDYNALPGHGTGTSSAVSE